MIPGKDLYHLVQSLTMSEQRYFKLMLRQRIGKKGKNYVMLFDAIAAHNEYDEQRIRKELKGQIKNFSATKLQLYHLLLGSLRLYHARTSGENILYEYLQNIEILFNRGLYRECRSMVKKAQKTAHLYENRLVGLELNNWEVRLMREMKYEHTTKKHLENLHRNEIGLLDQYRTISICRYNANKFFWMHLHNAYVRSKQSAKKLRASLDFSLLHKKEIPAIARIILYFTVSGYFISIGNHKKCYRYNKQLIALLESVAYPTIEIQRYYANALINMCITLRELKRFTELNQTLQKLSNLSVKNENLSIAISSFFYFMKGDILTYHGEFKKAATLMNEVIEYINKNKTKIDNATRQVLNYLIAYSYFGDAQFSLSIEWTNRIMNQMKTDRRFDVFLAARLLHILSHIEKGHYDVAAYLGKSYDREFLKNEKEYRIEKALIEFIRKNLLQSSLPFPFNKRNIRDAFKVFKPIAEKILNDPFEQKLLEYIDLHSWLTSKIENKPFAEIVRRKNS